MCRLELYDCVAYSAIFLSCKGRRLQGQGKWSEQMTERLHSGLADDLNTNPAIAGLSDPLKRANELCHTKKVILPEEIEFVLS